MTLTEETAKILKKRLTEDEKQRIGIEKRSAKWRDAVALSLVKKRAGGDVRRIKLLREISSGAKTDADAVINVRMTE